MLKENFVFSSLKASISPDVLGFKNPRVHLKECLIVTTLLYRKNKIKKGCKFYVLKVRLLLKQFLSLPMIFKYICKQP